MVSYVPLVMHAYMYRIISLIMLAMCCVPCYQSAFSHQVFEEALRMYPPVPAIGKVAPKGLTLCGYRIPEGTNTLVWD